MGFGETARESAWPAIQRAKIKRLIHSDIDEVDWEAVLDLLATQAQVTDQSQQEQDSEDDPRGRALLSSIISRYPPVAVVEATMHAYPECVTQNRSAFFTAFTHASDDVIRLLARVHLEAVRGNVPGSCPYPWITIRQVRVRGARILLEEYPEGVVQGGREAYAGYSPLDNMIFLGGGRGIAPDPQWWEKLDLFLMAAEYGTVNPALLRGRNFRSLHCLLRRVASRPDFFSHKKLAQNVLWILQQMRVTHPDRFRVADDDGSLPLHIALRGRCRPGTCFAETRELVNMILEMHPQSARISDHEGRLALHVAVENRWPCHDILLPAAPQALHTRDRKTRLYPFQLAACSLSCWGDSSQEVSVGFDSLDIAYELLREGPLLAEGLATTVPHYWEG